MLHWGLLTLKFLISKDTKSKMRKALHIGRKYFIVHSWHGTYTQSNKEASCNSKLKLSNNKVSKDMNKHTSQNKVWEWKGTQH